MPVARIGAGQGTQRHHPRHEAEIGGRFAGPDQLVHLIGLGEMVPRLGRGLEGFHSAARTRDDFTYGEPARRVVAAWIYSPMFPRQDRGTTLPAPSAF